MKGFIDGLFKLLLAIMIEFTGIFVGLFTAIWLNWLIGLGVFFIMNSVIVFLLKTR